MTKSARIPLVTLTSDFGLDDAYVGVMKGVILKICPRVRLIDLTHSIPQGDILKASLVLRSAVNYFPSGTIHLVVVDPGVGGERLPVAIHSRDMFFIGPNNGLFWFLRDEDPPPRAVKLEKYDYFLPETSNTFHGRDIFAPVAAHIGNGIQLDAFGPRLRDLVELSLPRVKRIDSGTYVGEVFYIDHFGNCVSNLAPNELGFDIDPSWVVELEDGNVVPVCRYYSQVPRDKPVALVGSSGHLEIAVRDGSAAEQLGLQRGVSFVVRKNG